MRRASVDWRAGREVVKRGKAVGLRINQKSLNRALADGSVRRALEARVPADLALARDRLASVRTEGSLPSNIPDLLELVRLGYLATGEVSMGLAQISQQITQLQSSSGSGTGFESHLTRISPVLAIDARAVHGSQAAAIERAVAAIVSSGSRSDLLRQWATTTPPWIIQDPSLLGWLAECSIDCEAKDAALVWIDRAIEAGASPLGYWRMRRVWVAGVRKEDEEANLAYLADVNDHPLVMAALTSTPDDERDAHLDSWEPSTETQRAVKSTIRTDFLRDRGDLAEAIQFGTAEWHTHCYAASGLSAVEALLRRSTTVENRAHAGDLSRALELALDIRAQRRSWGSSSGPAVALAMRVYMLLMDPERAWALSQTEHDGGEATPSEAAHPKVRNEAVILMSERGSISTALEQIDESYSEAARLQVEAREAELLLDDARANELWSKAIEATEDWNEKASLCFRLAMRGQVDPFVDELATNGNNEIAKEIRLVAQLFSHSREAEQHVREESLENPRLAHALIAYLSREDRYEDVVFVAERSAERWGDADDWLKAARAHQVLGRLDKAIDDANRALQVGGKDWGDQFGARVVLLEVAFQQDDWPSASLNASTMIALRPNSESARWALVLAKYHAGDQDEAFADWSEIRPPPSSAAEAGVWFTFLRLHGRQMATAAEAVRVAREFGSNEQVRNVAVGAFLLADFTGDLSTDAITELLKEFEAAYPDSHGYVRVDLDMESPETLLEQLDEVAGGPRDLSEIDRAISFGTIPVGMVSRVTNKLLAEALVVASNRPRFVGRLQIANEAAAAAAAFGSVPTIDVTALLTLAMLPAEASIVVFSQFAGARTTSQQLLDANSSRESLSRASGGHFIPSTPHAPARFMLDDPAERDRQVELSASLVEWFRRTRRESHPMATSETVISMAEASGTWTTALDLAISDGSPFWCDDAATRKLAELAKIPTFGTAAIVEHLRVTGSIPSELADSIDASLILRASVGIPYRFQTYALALSLDNYEPKGCAAALRFSGPDDFEQKLTQIFFAMGKVDDPVSLEQWARVAADYVDDLSNDPEQKATNQIGVTSAILRAPWITKANLPFALRGVKDAYPETFSDGFRLVVAAFFESLVSGSGHEQSSAFLLGLTELLEQSEREAVLETVLTSD